ncbi:hypothetical protein F4803DRAFT_398017 [Xylaria telfairii]|nr:hypothetical protein F4803DRAFT_398017 [Xylaria telfairii]
MRFHTLIVVFVAAGAVAETNIEVARQGGQTDVNGPRILDQAPSTLAVRSRLRFHALSTRRTTLETKYNAPLTTLSRREEDNDEDEDEDGDSESDGDHDEDDRNNKHRPNTVAIAGGVVGGVVLLLLLLFLLFWFKFRSRRRNRRRQRDEEEEEERKRKKEGEEQENGHAANVQRPYQPIPSDEPPHYQQVVAAAAPPSSPPRGTADFPAELPSPVDGREPSPLPPPSHLDFSKETHGPRQPTQITIHPEERPGRAY